MMRTLLILLLLPSLLFANEIDYEEFISMVETHSYKLEEYSDSITIAEEQLKATKFPQLVSMQTTVSPTYSFDDGEFSMGSLGLSITPYHNISLGISYDFEESTSLGVSLSPFVSKRDRILQKRSSEIAITEASEAVEEFYTSLKKDYMNLYFSRELFKLRKTEFDILKREIDKKENLFNAGEIDLLTMDELYLQEMEMEELLFNEELALLQLEDALYHRCGFMVQDYTLKPIKWITDEDYNPEELELSEDTVYQRMLLELEDQKRALKEDKWSFIPDISISGGVTFDGSDFSGSYVSLSGSLPIDFNYSGKVKLGEIELKRKQKALDAWLDNREKVESNREREFYLKKRRLEIMDRSLVSTYNRLQVTAYSLEKGDILQEDYDRMLLNYRRNHLELKKSECEFYLDYLDK